MESSDAQISLRDGVIDALRRQILDGDLAPGTPLRERGVAESLGVSRVPVREAFRQLETEGLLESQARRSVRVAAVGTSEIETVHEIRLALELLAVRLTAQRDDPVTRGELLRVLENGRRAETDDDEAALRALNREFHDVLARGSGSSVLASLLRSARNHARRIEHGRETIGVARSWHDHAAIVEAILSADGDGAQQLMRDHLEAHHADAVQHVDAIRLAPA